ncbi:hypothetical protein EV697_101301 [Bisgaardia hudsonensis]|uniref:Lipoprotein n=1 Tax=Bisgaardia hudsonensis TaxID=109472 RepID=A0A4R2N2S0_9PAST|nr:hypothetical protein [Bisgaardia hudsonensis]QLB12626.1 hypothetical protein A6A11_02895 [Bisgaardia hudsonensis]TCP14168.1 hypothetical protein EV697_101301 [Bisgaardia hudsonensis]
MKLTKTILSTTLIACATLLTACYDKDSQKQQNLPVQSQGVKDQALQLFNMTVRILPEQRFIGKDEKGNDFVSFAYTLENISNKAIKEIQWFNILTAESTIIDITNVPAVFEKTLQANSSEKITLTKLAIHYPENVRKLILNPKTELKSKTLAGKIIFADDSKLVITTPEDIEKAFSKNK